MKILTVSDLHLRISLYDQLAEAVALHQPDVVCLVGDFLDAGARTDGMLTPEAAALRLAAITEGREMVCVRGNHEEETWPVFESAWSTTKRPLHALHGSAVSIGGLTIVGFPCWMGSDSYYAIGRELPVYQYKAWLPQLMRAAGPSGRTFWIMHEPPCLELSEVWLREPEWKDAIRQFQPLAVVSGHDHTTPVRTGVWSVKVGRTQVVNLGQRVCPTGRLLYATMQFKISDDGAPRLVGKIARHG